MKRFTFFSLIFFIAISICFFSATVIAGEGAVDDRGDTHPWDLDVVVNDSLDDGEISYRSGELVIIRDPFTWAAFSLSNTFSLWIYENRLVSKEENQFNVVNKSYNYRGKLSR